MDSFYTTVDFLTCKSFKTNSQTWLMHHQNYLFNRFTKPLLDNSRSKVLLKSIGIAYKLYFEGIFRLGQLICELYFLFIWQNLGLGWKAALSLSNGTYLKRCEKTMRVRNISRDLVPNFVLVTTASTLNLSTWTT